MRNRHHVHLVKRGGEKAESWAIASNVLLSKSTRSILFTANTTVRTPSSSAARRWRRVCSTMPVRASTNSTTTWEVDTPVTVLRVYCTCPGVSARMNVRLGVEK